MSFTGTRRTNDSPTNTGLTDLRIFLPGFPDDGSVVFTPDFKALCRRYQIIRFMDWMDTNLNPLRNFSDRTLPIHATQARQLAITDEPDLGTAGAGVAFEHMIQLCNQTDCDMWINVPARATDDFVRKMLILIRDGKGSFRGLNPERKLYVEFANEIWNTSFGFLSFSRVKKQSDAALQDPEHPINFDGNTDEFEAFFRFIAFRAKTISDLCREVFGEEQMMTRVRPLLESQFGDGQATLSTGLRFTHLFFSVVRPNNPVALRTDQIFFGGGGAGYSLGDPTTRDTYFATIPQAEFVPSVRTDAVLTHGYGLKYVAYEGGPIIADPVTGAAVKDDVTSRKFNADPRMKTALISTHEKWARGGGDIFVYYVSTGDPAFEFTPNDQSLNSPKQSGIRTLAAQDRLPATTGVQVPGDFFATDNPHLINEGNFLNDADQIAFLRANTFLGKGQIFLPVNTQGNVATNFDIRLETLGSAGGGTIDVFFNGVKLKRLEVPSSETNGSFVFRNVGSVTTEFGVNVLRILCTKGEVQLKRVRMQ